MVQLSLGLPYDRSLLPETPDPPSLPWVSAAVGEPDFQAFDAPSAEVGVADSSRLERLIASLRRSPGFEVVAEQVQSPSGARYQAWPTSIDPRVIEIYRRRGLHQIYDHQAQALQAIGEGRDVVLATATASGKSLCFQAPLLQAIAEDPHSRALLLYPTKALARDQVEGMRKLAHEGRSLGLLVGLGIYDGDASPDQRRAAKRHAHAVATNPDMLHRSILPHHREWADFLSGLRFVVLDEVHVYRGLFGAHVGQVLRRLWRLCAHYGSRPQVIACSATIANPSEHTARLCARPQVVAITQSGAPKGGCSYLVVNPKVIDPLVGVRRDFLKVTREVAATVRRHALSALLFCRTRKAVELMTRYLREDEVSRHQVGAGSRQNPELAGLARDQAQHVIRGYRGGYLPALRREVEGALRDGQAQLVAATNALELGMDIGQLDVVILAGYPGSRAAVFQRAGRAGRRGQSALVILVLSSAPNDQFLANDPSFLFDHNVEQARTDPDNPEVLIPHLRCAAFELPFRSGEVYPGLSAAETFASLEYLETTGSLVFEGHSSSASPAVTQPLLTAITASERVGAWLHQGADFPAHAVEIRGTLEQNFSVIAADGANRGEVLAEVEFDDAPVYLHVGAIYAIEGRTHEVLQLDWLERKAYVRAVAADYYTEAIAKLRVRVLDSGPDKAPAHGTGYLHVLRTYPAFKKIRLRSHETIGSGPIKVPDWEMHTQVAYWSAPAAWLAQVSAPQLRAKVALSAAHALLHTASLVCMCEASDLGSAVAGGEIGGWAPVIGGKSTTEAEVAAMGTPVIYLYDRQPGGSGLATHVAQLGAVFLQRAAAVVAGCRCASGCPVCLGADHLNDAPAAGDEHRSAPYHPSERGPAEASPAEFLESKIEESRRSGPAGRRGDDAGGHTSAANNTINLRGHVVLFLQHLAQAAKTVSQSSVAISS